MTKSLFFLTSVFGSIFLCSLGAKAQGLSPITNPAAAAAMDLWSKDQPFAPTGNLETDRARLAEILLRIEVNAVHAKIDNLCKDHLPTAPLEQVERQMTCTLNDIKAEPVRASELVRGNEPDIRRALDEIDRIYHQGAAMSADPDACASNVLARYQYLFKQQSPQQ